MTLFRLARCNAAVNRRQSLLVFGLVAASSFLLVAASANTRRFAPRTAGDFQSGSGGFAIVATAAIAIPGDFSTPAGRALLNFSPADEAAMTGTQVYGLLLSPGENISCLNPSHPMAPEMVGVSHAFIQRGGFSARWQDLEKVGACRAFADGDTARWMLGTDLGQTYAYRNGSAQADLHIAGLLSGSIFAGELLVPENQFRRLFPEETTPRFFLIQTPVGQADEVAAVLRRNLGALGLDVRTSSDLLNAVAAVQNTYISAFSALGGLGMLLGTGVLAALLLRSAGDRRKELALLSAIGIRERDISVLLLLETVGLLVTGVIWGACCALISMGPYLVQSSAAPNWSALTAILGIVILTGLAACLLAAWAAIRGPLLAALRSE